MNDTHLLVLQIFDAAKNAYYYDENYISASYDLLLLICDVVINNL